MIKFYLTDEQETKAEAWRIKHIADRHDSKYPNAGAIGGAFGYKFISTGLGIISIHYCMCGGEINLTNFEEW